MISSALSTTTAVSQWLHTAQSPRVLHRFDQVCNLVDAERRVISLVTPEIGQGPFSLVVDLANGRLPQLLTAKSQVSIARSTLQIGTLVVDTSKAELWQARPLWERVSTDSLKAALPLFERKLAAASPASLAHVDKLSGRSHVMVSRVETAVYTLQAALKTDKIAAFKKSAQELAGLGAGLTPAGDDFLLGVIYGLWLTAGCLRSAAETERIVAVLAEEAQARTTTLSSAWLCAAARGEAGQAWHGLVQALALTATSSVNAPTNSVDAVSQAIDRILATGHTSGADAFAGFVMTISTRFI